jgi:hypothetical protein
MALKRITLIVAVALSVAAVMLGGCSKPTATQSTSTTQAAGSAVATTQASVEPTAPATINSAGPITTPASSSTTRKELLSAARIDLGAKLEFNVYQMYVQGDTALVDLEPTTKTTIGRAFVAFERRSGAWVAIGALKFGGPASNAASTARALPSFSAQLIAKIDWTMRKPGTKAKAAPSAPEATVKASLSTSALAWTKEQLVGASTPYKVTMLKVAKDANGVWWGRVITEPTGGERIQFWAKYDGTAWSGAAQDVEPPAPTTYFPKSVVAKLGF